MAAAIAYAHDRSQARIVFQTRPGAYSDSSLIEFLEALHGQLSGAKVSLVCDGLPSRQPPHARLDPPPAPLPGRGTPARLRPLSSTPSRACGATSKACARRVRRTLRVSAIGALCNGGSRIPGACSPANALSPGGGPAGVTVPDASSSSMSRDARR
jgi:hypothetical protein